MSADKSAGWASVQSAASYIDMSERKLRAMIAKNEIQYVRLPSGMIRIKYSWLDEHLERYRVRGDADRLVDEILGAQG